MSNSLCTVSVSDYFASKGIDLNRMYNVYSSYSHEWVTSRLGVELIPFFNRHELYIFCDAETMKEVPDVYFRRDFKGVH